MLVMTSGERGPQGITPGSASRKRRPRSSGLPSVGWLRRRLDPGRPRVGGRIDSVLRRLEADVVYTHAPNDSHQDHVAVVHRLAGRGPPDRRASCTTRPRPRPRSTRRSSSTSARRSRTRWPPCARTGRRSWTARWSTSRRSHAGVRYWGQRARTRYAEAFESPRFLWQVAPADLPGAGRARPRGPAVALTTGRPTAASSPVRPPRRWTRRRRGRCSSSPRSRCSAALPSVSTRPSWSATVGVNLVFLVFFLRHVAFAAAAVRWAPKDLYDAPRSSSATAGGVGAGRLPRRGTRRRVAGPRPGGAALPAVPPRDPRSSTTGRPTAPVSCWSG